MVFDITGFNERTAKGVLLAYIMSLVSVTGPTSIGLVLLASVDI